MLGKRVTNNILRLFSRLFKRVFREYPAVLKQTSDSHFTSFVHSRLIEPPNVQHTIIDETAVLSLIRGKTVLDCGCGIGRWGYLLRKKGCAVVGFDLTKSNVIEAKKLSKYSALLVADASYLPFKEGSFDCLMAVELLEHLPKEKGVKFLEDTKRLARKLVVLSTPSGYFEALCDLPGEIHQSGWNKEELEAFGFRCWLHKNNLYDWLLCIHNKVET